jgi:diguanylate cyclase (GGDEF)-like protein/PAS domain S-box-containing protein
VRVITAFVFFLLSIGQAWAIHVIEIKDRHTNSDISQQMEYLQAAPQLRWPWEVAQLQGWQVTAADYPAFGLDNRSYWFRVAVHNRSGELQYLMMDIQHSMLDILDIYLVKNGRLHRVWNTGVDRGVAAKPYPSKAFTLPLTLDVGEGYAIYMHAQSDSFMQFPVRLQDIRFYANQQAVGKLQMGLVSGAFILVGLYALLMYAFIRERRFIYYALFALSLVATTWILKGYATLYEVIPDWLDELRLLLTTGNMLLMGLILSSLDMFRIWLPPRLRRTCRLILMVVAAVMVIVWLFPLVWSVYITFGSYLLVTLLAASFCLYFIRRGTWLQRLYCYSWFGFMLGCLSLFATRYTWLRDEWISEYLLSLFSAMAAFLLCFSLAYRTYLEKKGRMRAKRQASEGLKRYFELYHSANEGLFTSTLEGQLLAANPAFCRMFGYDDIQTMATTVGRTTHVLYVNGKDRDDLLAKLFTSAKEGVRSDVEMRHKDGTTFWARLSLRISRRNGKNRSMLLEGILVDITESKQYQARLEYLANHDEATGLHNRRYLIQALESLFKRRHITPGTDYLCFIDIDHFKVINEGGGHLAGDEFLRQIANHISNLKKDNFLLTRLSGDEFAVVMENSYIDEVIQYVERWRKAIQELKFVWNGKIYSVTASLGVVPIQSGCNDASALMALADAACSTAKRQGRNRIHVYSDLSPEMRLYQEEVAWVARIHQALEERRFELARQLIVPSQGTAPGLKYEILLRLRAENGELIRPAQFIGAAERFGLMPQIDLWVLDNLLKWYAANPDELARLSMVSVNLSGESVGTPKMHRKIRRLLEAADFPYERLCFEITESQAIANIDATKAFIETFKGLGCAFALDDFGSGFSSYGHLKELPIDLLKIDGQFVRHLDTSETDRAIVNSMAELARAVGIKTVAEFVENSAIREKLVAMGVDYLQGYAIHEPSLLSEPIEE